MLIPDFCGFPEPQWTKAPNLFYDSLAGKLSLSQLRVMLFFIRATMGWHKDHEFVPAPIARIEEVMGLSKQSVIDAIQFLEENGFIARRKTRDGRRQGVSEYRLRFLGDTEEEASGSKTLTLKKDSSGSKDLTLEDVNVDPEADRSFSVFKEISSKENIPLPPSENSQPQTQSPTPAASLDLEDDVLVFAQNAYRRENRKAKLANLQARSRQSLAEDLRRAETQWEPEEFRSALVAFLKSRDEWLQQNAWPLSAFLKQIDRWMPQGCAPAPRPVRAATLEVVQAPPSAPEAPARRTALPPEAEIWNEVVTSGAKLTAFDWEMQEGRDLSRCRDHKNFSQSAWRTVCEKAEVAIQNECGWVTFRWLVKKNDNWWKVMQGEYDTYRPKNKPKTGNAVETLSEKVTRVQNELARSKAVNG